MNFATYGARRKLRQIDNNTLLRMYDHARSSRGNSVTKLEKTRTELAFDRLSAELRNRGLRI
jgi:hypothetical protein